MKQGDGLRYFSIALTKKTAPHLQPKTEETKPAAQACCQFRELVGICVPFGGTFKGFTDWTASQVEIGRLSQRNRYFACSASAACDIYEM